jgi:phytoene/squalene synthetase
MTVHASPSAVPSSPTGVEAPSGKDADYENFPVGSALLPARLRPHVARFYAFARAIDDIADSPDLTPEEKVARLDGFEAAITGRDTTDPDYAKGHALRESLAATNRDWADLMDYCLLSAAPVGRYLIDLHGGSSAGYASSDALCNALQVINHLQDCQDDYRTLNRVYLPDDWLAAEGLSVEALDAPACSPALRRVIDRCLDGTRALLDEARPLAGDIRDRRLGMEAAVIVEIAKALTAKLARQDPLATRVKLSKGEALVCALKGVPKGLFVSKGVR